MPTQEISFDESVWYLLEIMSTRYSSMDSLVNQLLEKSLRLSDIKRQWIELMYDMGMTEDEIIIQGKGSVSGNAGIRAIYSQIKRSKEYRESVRNGKHGVE